jgi:hypothetical protein
MSERVRRLEESLPKSVLGPFTADEIRSIDDLTLCRYAIQSAERAIAEDPGCDVFGVDTRQQFGATTDEEVLTILRSCLAEMEAPHASA